MSDLSPAQDPTPRELGFAMPAEWAPHAATWLSWPADDELWFGHLKAVRGEFAELVRTIARFERVQLLVRDEESDTDARARLHGADVTFHRVPLDDVWVRDNGPIFVQRGGEVALTDWKFNSWGGKFEWHNDDRVPAYVAGHLGVHRWALPFVLEGGGLEVNGAGVGLTTRSCFLTETRNPGLTEEGYTLLLSDMLGVDKLLWLDGGLENDHTDGHIDTITRFTDERTIVTSVESNPDDPNHAVMAKNLADLRAMTDAGGQPFRIVELPLPAHRLEGAEGRLPPTYANFYIGNGFVAVPQYGDPNDARALEVLTPLFPGREVIGLSSRAIIEGGGSFHCVTQQQPAGQPWKPE
ncbi:agmatine deiminase family protein [Deinococcus multiflagellatus]|uniref:Agmatine deiminase family protein n=1 Tax=Deinococcus multiflagellatus TaxID=1656887 RepID=A0ABW1ZNI8_9DEIO|nr:agmatine deiminase family protein [Deinococcus multiflagellatus]MBZ9713366.1 agmatine deiminase family protein [Deinococcus multiflagellatus]